MLKMLMAKNMFAYILQMIMLLIHIMLAGLNMIVMVMEHQVKKYGLEELTLVPSLLSVESEYLELLTHML